MSGLALVLTGYAFGIAWLLWRIETTPPVCREDMREPGEEFCAACPDHEACATGWPCWKVREVNA